MDISLDASNKTIKKAFSELAMVHHPDKGGDRTRFKEIHEAYRILKNPILKADYDAKHTRLKQMFPIIWHLIEKCQ